MKDTTEATHTYNVFRLEYGHHRIDLRKGETLFHGMKREPNDVVYGPATVFVDKYRDGIDVHVRD